MKHDHDVQPGQTNESPIWRSRYGLAEQTPPTLLTLVMFPVLLVMYGRLALTEEPEMRTQFGEAFEHYAQRTPRFIPRMGKVQATADPVSKR